MGRGRSVAECEVDGGAARIPSDRARGVAGDRADVFARSAAADGDREGRPRPRGAVLDRAAVWCRARAGDVRDRPGARILSRRPRGGVARRHQSDRPVPGHAADERRARGRGLGRGVLLQSAVRQGRRRVVGPRDVAGDSHPPESRAARRCDSDLARGPRVRHSACRPEPWRRLAFGTRHSFPSAAHVSRSRCAGHDRTHVALRPSLRIAVHLRLRRSGRRVQLGERRAESPPLRRLVHRVADAAWASRASPRSSCPSGASGRGSPIAARSS